MGKINFLWMIIGLCVDYVSWSNAIDDKGCGKTKGCFRTPSGCSPSDCKYFVTWTNDVGGKWVDIEVDADVESLATSTPYTAVGFGKRRHMDDCSVTDCIISDQSLDSIIVQTSYNSEHHHNKVLKNDQLGLVNGHSSGRLSNGRLYCKFSRYINADSSDPEADKVFSLGENQYYLILASGRATSGIKSRHKKTAKSSVQISTAVYQDVGSILVNSKNEDLLEQHNKKELEQEGENSLQNSSKSGDHLKPEKGISNKPALKQNPYDFQHSNDDKGRHYSHLKPESESSNDVPLQKFQTNAQEHLSQNSLTHADNTPSSISEAGCGVVKGCFSYPTGCEMSKCDFFLSWNSQSESVDFELLANVGADNMWAGFGIARLPQMANSSVVDCIVYNGKPFIQMSYNNEEPDNEMLPDPSLGLVKNSLSASFVDGKLQCKFSRLKAISQSLTGAGKVFNLNGLYYILLARGQVNSKGIKIKHKATCLSDNAVSFEKNSTATVKNNMLVKIHVALMTSSWLIAAAIGAMVGLHFQTVCNVHCCKHALWFWLHRCLMLSAVIGTAGGFIAIVLNEKGLKLKGYHQIIGFCVIIGAGINPLISYFRPRTKPILKSVMRTVHLSMGLLLHFGAIVAIYFGVRMVGELLPVYMEWAILGFLGFTLLVDIIFLAFRRGLSDSRDYEYTLIGSVEEVKRNSCLGWFAFVLSVYILVAFGLGLLLVVNVIIY